MDFVSSRPGLLILCLLPEISFGAAQTNPFMILVKINAPSCIAQNLADCLKSICIVSPGECKAQFAANSSEKCRMLLKQQSN